MRKKISDHSFWGGSQMKESVCPQGVKSKKMMSGSGEGYEINYPDTAEEVKSDQEMNCKKMKKNEIKGDYRH